MMVPLTEVEELLPPTVSCYQNFNLYPQAGDTGNVAAAKNELKLCGHPNGFNTKIATRNKGKEVPQATALQADCDWNLLGERSVDLRADHDEIAVNKDDTYNGLQLRIQGAPVTFQKVTVYFLNGTPQVLEMRDEIPAGGHTRTIDLENGEEHNGEERHITRVAFSYKTDASRGERAVVQLWGMT